MNSSPKSSPPNPPLVIIGPSGSGKSSVVKILCDHYGYTLMKTVTTRPQRDAFDTDHEFISLEVFEEMKRSNKFFGILEVFGASYGLPRFNLDGKIVLLLRAPALPEFLTHFPSTHIIEIDAPLEVLKKRLERRGTPDRFDPVIIKKEIALGAHFAHAVFNSSQQSSEEIAEQIIKSVSKAEA